MAWWQVAAGDGGRDYSCLFIRFSVFCIGPGRHGDYFAHREAYRDERAVQRFAEELTPGDRLALKAPAGANRWRVVAVGEIVGDYSWERAFEDVEGWDLEHVRRVDWRRVDEEPIKGLRRGMLSRVGGSSSVLDAMWERTTADAKDLPDLPQPASELLSEDLAWAFLAHGLSVERSDRLTATIDRLSRLAAWYDRNRSSVSEHEIRTFLVIPLLAALGWPEQHMKIEWRRVDIALFDKPFTDESNATLLVESKRLGSGLSGAADQARSYAENHPDLRSLVVTDGFRYMLYERPTGHWQEAAYANLTRLRDWLPTLSLPGADTLFLKLLPATRPLGLGEVAPRQPHSPKRGAFDSPATGQFDRKPENSS